MTYWIRCDGQSAGFVSLDLRRLALELVYIDPDFRGRALAALAVAELARGCPRPPGGEDAAVTGR